MNKTFLLIILATVCNTAFAWSLFGPKNYEDCVLEELKGVPNNDSAVRMVRQACKKKFPAEYKPPTTPQEVAPKENPPQFTLEGDLNRCSYPTSFPAEELEYSAFWLSRKTGITAGGTAPDLHRTCTLSSL